MNTVTALKTSFKRGIARVNPNNLSNRAKLAILVAIILGVWLALVIITTTRHEFWRDEVRALSLVRTINSPSDFYRLTSYEGHPVLWYILLYIGNSISGTPYLLQIASIIIAFAAVTIFLVYSPFPFWIRCLFLFSFPSYEYAVMTRNYGISMLLMFVAAALYKNRAKHFLLLAFVLVLLANTNVHSAILTCLITALWIWDVIIEQRKSPLQVRRFSLYLPFLIAFIGVLLSILSTIPREDTAVTSVYSLGITELTNSLSGAVLRPGETFSQVTPTSLSLFVASALLYLSVFGLIHKPNLFLVALGGQIAFGMFFRVVYYGAYRHQGLFIIFLLFLYWIYIHSRNKETITTPKRILFNAGFSAVVILVIWNVLLTTRSIQDDTNLEKSSNKAFGKFINTSPTYADAIIIPEPGYLIESLPYYTNNKIYFPREDRFGTTVRFTRDTDHHLSLGKLLSTARNIKTRYNRPVLIVLGHWDVGEKTSGEKRFSYNDTFLWESRDYEIFNNSTIPIATFNRALGDENYRVYRLK